jgi:transcriptional regulator with XRE-family HTH domain
MNYVASNLKFLRKQTGLSQDQFAVRLDLNRGNIASYEKGSAEPSIEKIVKFAAFFNIDVTSFIQKDLSGAAINTMPGMTGAATTESAPRTSHIDWESFESDEAINGHQLRKDINYISQSLERIAVAVESLLKVNKEFLRRQAQESELV